MSNRGGRNKGPLPRDVQISKKLSWLLRHGAEQEGLQLDKNGYLNLHDVLNNRKIKGLKPKLEEVQEIVKGNDKQRFTLTPVNENATLAEGGGTKASEWLIRANQGHSLKVEEEGLLKPVSAENAPETAVHGTTHAAWPLIVAAGGLKPMGRNHVHFASGLPEGFKSLVDENDAPAADTAAAPVISGMRKSSTVLMFLDVGRALAAGVKLWVSDNGVILSEGNAEGLVPLELFGRVEDRTGLGVLVEEGKVVKEAPASWGAKGSGKG